MPNKEFKTLHLTITCKVGEVPCMNELKKGFTAGICYFVGFAPGRDEVFQHQVNEGNLDNSTSSATELDQASYLASGDAICSKAENLNVYGSLGIFAVKDDHSVKNHLVITCYHVCYNGENSFPKNRNSLDWHKILTEDSKNVESPTRQTEYWYRHRLPDNEEGGEKNDILGKFYWGKKDEFHDIGFIEVKEDIKCRCTIDDIDDKKIATRKEIGEEMEKGELIVEKTGFRTKKTRGILTQTISRPPLFRDGYLIKSKNHDQPFANLGDSGSLVKVVVNDKKLPFAYFFTTGNEYQNSQEEFKKHVCFSLDHSLKDFANANEGDVKPCLKLCGAPQCSSEF